MIKQDDDIDQMESSTGPEDFGGSDEESHLMSQDKIEESADTEPPEGEKVEPKPGKFYAYLPSIGKTDPKGFNDPRELAEYATYYYYTEWRMSTEPPSEEQGEFVRPKFNGPAKVKTAEPPKPQGPPGKVLTPEQQAIVDQTKPPPVTFTKETMAAWNAFQVCLQATQSGDYVLVNNPRIGPFPPEQAVNLAGWLCIHAIKAGLDENEVSRILSNINDMAREQGVLP